MEREYLEIDKLKDELLYLEKEYQASFKIDIYKTAIVGEIGYTDYEYTFFNSVKIKEVENFVNEFEKIISNKNLIALLEKSHLDIRVLAITPARKNWYKPEYAYETIAYMTYYEYKEVNGFDFFYYDESTYTMSHER